MAVLIWQKVLLLQEGRYIAGVQTQPNQNLSGYTVFPFTDLQDQNDMNPLLGSCFGNSMGLTITPGLMQQVNECTAKNTICCYIADDQVSVDQHGGGQCTEEPAQRVPAY